MMQSVLNRLRAPLSIIACVFAALVPFSSEYHAPLRAEDLPSVDSSGLLEADESKIQKVADGTHGLLALTLTLDIRKHARTPTEPYSYSLGVHAITPTIMLGALGSPGMPPKSSSAPRLVLFSGDRIVHEYPFVVFNPHEPVRFGEKILSVLVPLPLESGVDRIGIRERAGGALEFEANLKKSALASGCFVGGRCTSSESECSPTCRTLVRDTACQPLNPGCDSRCIFHGTAGNHANVDPDCSGHVSSAEPIPQASVPPVLDW